MKELIEYLKAAAIFIGSTILCAILIVKLIHLAPDFSFKDTIQSPWWFNLGGVVGVLFFTCLLNIILIGKVFEIAFKKMNNENNRK